MFLYTWTTQAIIFRSLSFITYCFSEGSSQLFFVSVHELGKVGRNIIPLNFCAFTFIRNCVQNFTYYSVKSSPHCGMFMSISHWFQWKRAAIEISGHRQRGDLIDSKGQYQDSPVTWDDTAHLPIFSGQSVQSLELCYHISWWLQLVSSCVCVRWSFLRYTCLVALQ